VRPFGIKRAALRAPFPWFGGKARVAHLAWERFGDVRNYVEPFFGSGAVLLGRPGEPSIETVNDADAYLSNFWRAVATDPDEVARWADWPVNEADLHARHRWLMETARERVEKVKTDPDVFDAKVAGWWVWGQCLWIGSGWCAKPAGKRPQLSSKGGSNGIHAIKRWEPSGKHPLLHKKHPALAAEGFSASSVRFPTSPAILELQGAESTPLVERSGGLQAYMRALSDRLRRVRVCCGDFERILGPAVTTGIGTTAVLLDPPYDTDGRAICYAHDGKEEASGKSVWWRAYRWAIEHGDDPELRIALCGYEHPEAVFPEGWTEIAWKASGGYGRSERGRANALRERIWFSWSCLKPETQGRLFEG